jgi:phospholipase D1/2
MAGQPYMVSHFAASLRRQLFRKHLGLLKPQDYATPDDNFLPITSAPNVYDWGSPQDLTVVDPLDEAFISHWQDTAKTNTDVFEKVFHVVPSDKVQTWKEYDTFFDQYFHQPADPKKPDGKPVGKYKVGHVVREDFPGGVDEVKEWLSRVRGTLVEMPLLFLKQEDIAKEGLELNAMTEELYT